MKLETENKKIILVFKTRKIIEIANSLGNKNFEEVYFKAVQNNDLNALSKILYTLAEVEDGEKPFKSSTEVFDFIDDYKKENNKTYSDIFKEVTEAINDEGFFMQKMDKKQIEEMMSNPLSSMNMNDLVQKSAEKAITKIAEEQFQGFKA